MNPETRNDVVTPTQTPAADDLGFDLPAAAHVTKKRGVVVGTAAALVLAGAFVIGYLPRRHAQHELVAGAKSDASAAMKVQVVTPKAKTSDRSLELAGSVQALEETVVYPRVNGYVRSWNADIGDKVAAGAVLAEIETPETDQEIAQARAQLLQARAALAQSKANEQFSTTNLKRYQELTPQGITSQQELDQKSAQSSVDEANVAAAKAAITAYEANLQRLLQMKSFARVTAPFAGTVNARTIERGALVSPTTALFKISATDPVRVFIQVPQDLAMGVRPDVPAHVTAREYPGRVFEGNVTRTAGSLDATSRTMNTEIRVPNPKGELLSGMYAQVALSLPSSHQALELPATAVMTDAKGIRVAVVDASGHVKIVPVLIERDNGATIEIASGLSPGDRVVKLASPDLIDGRAVNVVP